MDLSAIIVAIHTFIGKFILVYMVTIIIVYTTMLLFALLYTRNRLKLDHHYVSEENLEMIYSKPVSILVPVYNEERGIIETVHSLLTLHYPQFEIIVINDGSTDNSLQVVIEQFEMSPVERTIKVTMETNEIYKIYASTIQPNIFLVDKANGGKSDALNAGINISRYPYFCSIDGDSILEKNSLLRIMQPIISSNDQVIASGGSIRIANGSHVQLGTLLNLKIPNKPLVIMEMLEYLRAFYIGRIALSHFNLTLIISGAFSVFSKNAVIAVNGYSRSTIGEDMELVVKLQRLIYEEQSSKRIEFLPDPICWTEAPDNFKDLRTQRRRWHQGLLGSLMIHKKMLFNPRYKQIGLVSMPYFFIIELLGPVIELLGYVYILFSFLVGNVFIQSALTMTCLYILYSTLLSIFAIMLEAWSTKNYPALSDLFKLFIYSLTEAFWFRPLTILYRIEGIYYYFRKREVWGALNRRGLSSK